jgi:O-antigen/teichoic acid export membrane protein
VDNHDVLDTAAAGGMVMRGALLRLLGYGAGSGLALVSAIVLTRHLGVDAFGQYTTIVAVSTIATQLTEGGLTSLTTREFAAERGGARAEHLRELLGLQIVTTGVAIAIATLFALAAGYNASRVIGSAVAALGLGLVLLQGTLAVPLVASLRLGLVSALELLRQAVFVTLTVVLVAAGAGLLPLLTALVPSSVIVLAATLWLTRDQALPRPALRPRAWRRLIGVAIAFSFATVLATIYAVTAQVVTSLVAGSHQTGLFSAAFRVFAVVASSAGLIVSSAYPLLARTAREDHARLAFALQRLLEVSVLLGMAAAIGAVTGAKAIISVLAGHKYIGAAPALRIEGLALLGTFLLTTWGFAIMSLREHRALVLSNAAALAVTAGLTLLLARHHGARGAAIAVVAGEWTLAAAFLRTLVRGETRLRPDARPLLRVGVAAAPAFAVMLLGLPAGFQVGTALSVYLLAIVVLRAYPRELLELLPRHRHREASATSTLP